MMIEKSLGWRDPTPYADKKLLLMLRFKLTVGRVGLKKRWRREAGVGAVLSFFLSTLLTVGAADTNGVSPEFVKQILERLEKDEQEIRELRQQLSNRPATPQPTNSLASPDSFMEQRLEKDESILTNLYSQFGAKSASERKQVYPSIQFHGFGDIDYAVDTRRAPNVPGMVAGVPYGVSYYGEKNTFILGEFDLFLTALLSENATVVSETGLSANSDNQMGIDIERLYFEYRWDDSFNFDFGRFHTPLGYYNTTFHHGVFLQTAIGRPTFLQFEDSGGILPIHMVGLEVHGAIPSGSLNLNYSVAVGNGEEFSANPNLDPVQQVLSVSDSKAVNVSLFARPDWLPGLHFGGNMYFDEIKPDNSGSTNNVPRNDQFIFGVNVAYNNAKWEFLNEGYLILDHPITGQSHYGTAFYTQLARKFGLFTPYMRFNYYKILLSDTLYSLDWVGGVNAGIHFGPSLGLRYDFTTFAALKLQYDYLIDSGYNDASRFNVQVCFSF